MSDESNAASYQHLLEEIAGIKMELAALASKVSRLTQPTEMVTRSDFEALFEHVNAVEDRMRVHVNSALEAARGDG